MTQCTVVSLSYRHHLKNLFWVSKPATKTSGSVSKLNKSSSLPREKENPEPPMTHFKSVVLWKFFLQTDDLGNSEMMWNGYSKQLIITCVLFGGPCKQMTHVAGCCDPQLKKTIICFWFLYLYNIIYIYTTFGYIMIYIFYIIYIYIYM